MSFVLKFEDLNGYDTQSAVYNCTNEEPMLHNHLLDTAGAKRLKKGLSICSGGEIPLFVMCHRVKELYAVDHSYGALTAAALKILVLQHLGPREAHRIFTTQGGMLKEVSPFVDQLPDTLKVKVEMNRCFDSYGTSDIRKEWGLIPFKVIERAAKHLDKITLIHGDVTDLKSKGPFDLLYLSNAFGHAGRLGSGLNVLTPALPDLSREGSYMLHTSGPIFGWDECGKVRGYRTSWDHFLQRRPKAQKEEKAA